MGSSPTLQVGLVPLSIFGDISMRRTLAYLLVACFVVGSLQAQTPAKQVSATTASPATVDSS